MSGHTIGWRRKSMIRTTYPDRICYRSGVMFTSTVCFSLRESGQGSVPHVLLGNPDGVDRNSHAHSVSSRRGVPTPCTRRRSLFAQHSSVHPGRNSARRHFTSGYLTSGWERRTFQLLRSDLSGSSDSAYQESFSLSIQCCGVLLKLPDISDRHLEIFCFRYLLSKSPKSPCNPPIIGFLSL